MSRKPRNYLFQYMDVLDQKTQEHLGVLVDISQGGIMLISQHPLPPGEIRDIFIETDIGEEQSHPPVKMQIVSVWNRPNINPALTCIGCRIAAIEPEDEHWLLKLAADITIHRIAHGNGDV
jgi:hypothetical protein